MLQIPKTPVGAGKDCESALLVEKMLLRNRSETEQIFNNNLSKSKSSNVRLKNSLSAINEARVHRTCYQAHLSNSVEEDKGCNITQPKIEVSVEKFKFSLQEGMSLLPCYPKRLAIYLKFQVPSSKY